MKTNPSIQVILDKYTETQNDYWLAVAGLGCLNLNETLPEPVRNYVIELLTSVTDFGIGDKLSRNQQKAATFFLHEEFLEQMQMLMYLTGTEKNPENVAYRIATNYAVNAGSKKKEYRSPTWQTLLNWWYNRPERFKEDLSVDDIPYRCYEEAVISNLYECSLFIHRDSGIEDIGPLHIKKELFEDMKPNPDDAELISLLKKEFQKLFGP